MAVFRPNIKCPLCGGDIHFIYNKLTEQQMETGWCGDTGGEYGKHDCKIEIRKNKINNIIDGSEEKIKK